VESSFCGTAPARRARPRGDIVGDGEAGWCDLIATGTLERRARGEKERTTLLELEAVVDLCFAGFGSVATGGGVLAQKCRQAGVTIPTVDVVDLPAQCRIAACAFGTSGDRDIRTSISRSSDRFGKDPEVCRAGSKASQSTAFPS